MSGLYELKSEYYHLLEMADDGDLDPDELEEALLDLDDEIEIVAEECAKVMAQLEGNNAAIDIELKRLQKKKARNTANAETLKRSLEKTMIAVKKEKFKTDLFSFRIQSNPVKLVVDHPDQVPSEYLIPQPSKADTAKIKAFLKGSDAAGKPDGICSWAHLEKSRSLRIQ